MKQKSFFLFLSLILLTSCGAKEPVVSSSSSKSSSEASSSSVTSSSSLETSSSKESSTSSSSKESSIEVQITPNDTPKQGSGGYPSGDFYVDGYNFVSESLMTSNGKFTPSTLSYIQFKKGEGTLKNITPIKSPIITVVAYSYYFNDIDSLTALSIKGSKNIDLSESSEIKVSSETGGPRDSSGNEVTFVYEMADDLEYFSLTNIGNYATYIKSITFLF